MRRPPPLDDKNAREFRGISGALLVAGIPVPVILDILLVPYPWYLGLRPSTLLEWTLWILIWSVWPYAFFLMWFTWRRFK